MKFARSPRPKLPFEPFWRCSRNQSRGLAPSDQSSCHIKSAPFLVAFQVCLDQAQPVTVVFENSASHNHPCHPFSLPQQHRLIRVLNQSQPTSRFSCGDLQGCQLRTRSRALCVGDFKLTLVVPPFRVCEKELLRLMPQCCSDSSNTRSKFMLQLTFSGSIIHWTRGHNTSRVNNWTIVSTSNRKKHLSCGPVRLQFMSAS